MNFGIPGTINSSVSSEGISVMAVSSKKTVDKIADAVWDDIFDNLTVENEPPPQYIRHVVIATKTGSMFKVSGKHFAEIIEQEKYITPEESEIESCRLNINFKKIRKDVDAWTSDLFDKLEPPASIAVSSGYNIDRDRPHPPIPTKRIERLMRGPKKKLR
jgi:hypothetical protein